MGSDRKMDSKTDSKPTPAQLWYNQFCAGPIRRHPLHDTINISQRPRAGRVTAEAALSASDLPADSHVAGDIASVAFGAPRGGTGLTTIATNKLLYSPFQDTLAELSIGSGLSLAAGVLSVGSHSHAESDVTGLVSDLAARPPKCLGFAPSSAAVINSSGAIIAGGTGNGYRLAELMSTTDPSGWSGVRKVKTPAGTTLGYILLYSNP